MSLSNLFNYFAVAVIFCAEIRLLFNIYQQHIAPALVPYSGFSLIYALLTGIGVRVILLAALTVVAMIQMR
jgi:hypothetical protein